MKVNFGRISEYVIALCMMIAIILNYFLNINLYYVEPLMIALIMILFVALNKKAVVYTTNILWFAAMAMACISVLYSMNRVSSLQYCVLLIFFCVLLWLCSQPGMDSMHIMNLMAAFCGFHVLVTFIQLILPSFFYSVASHFLSGAALSSNRRFWGYGTYCGLSDNPAPNGFFISIFVIIVFNKMITREKSKKKMIEFILVILSYVMLVLTKKRSFIIYVIIIMITSWYMGLKKNNRKAKYFLLSLILISCVGYLGYRLGIYDLAVEKMLKYFEMGDITNGRMDLWEQSLQYFNLHPVFGVGIRSLTTVMDNDSHNIYVQLLAEVGIFGALIFYTAIFFPFLSCIKHMIQSKTLTGDVFIVTSIQMMFVLYGMTGNPLFDHRFMWIYAVVVGVSVGIVKRTDKRMKESAD